MKILVVRRDNIGDLVCTTPLFTALRKRFPRAWIGALVNSYNAPVLERNPDLDEILAYTKLKHLREGETALGALGRRFAAFWKLRRMQLDCVVLATTDYVPRLARLARWLGPKQVAGFSDGSAAAASLELAIPVAQVAGRHEVERVFALASLFGVGGEIPPLTVVPDPASVARAGAVLRPEGLKIAVHISARRPAQRWPAERFADLIHRLQSQHEANALLLWSPGAAGDARHPGDDEKAREIMQRLGPKAGAVPYPTRRLQELIGALAACDIVVCSDGGASHIAAALGRPMVCFFGDSAVERWRPWGVPQRLIQPPSRSVQGIMVEEVLAAIASLAPVHVVAHPAA
jgi:ADP-heptose:LPS heptosyltransferase